MGGQRRYGVRHYWPGVDQGRKPIAVRCSAACGARVAGRDTTCTTSRVSCKRCLRSSVFRAVATERLLASHPCPVCSGSGFMPTMQNLRCKACHGARRVVPCYDCKGTQQSQHGGRCLICEGRQGTEPI